MASLAGDVADLVHRDGTDGPPQVIEDGRTRMWGKLEVSIHEGDGEGVFESDDKVTKMTGPVQNQLVWRRNRTAREEQQLWISQWKMACEGDALTMQVIRSSTKHRFQAGDSLASVVDGPPPPCPNWA
jgi:hypothetical protein